MTMGHPDLDDSLVRPDITSLGAVREYSANVLNYYSSILDFDNVPQTPQINWRAAVMDLAGILEWMLAREVAFENYQPTLRQLVKSTDWGQGAEALLTAIAIRDRIAHPSGDNQTLSEIEMQQAAKAFYSAARLASLREVQEPLQSAMPALANLGLVLGLSFLVAGRDVSANPACTQPQVEASAREIQAEIVKCTLSIEGVNLPQLIQWLLKEISSGFGERLLETGKERLSSAFGKKRKKRAGLDWVNRTIKYYRNVFEKGQMTDATRTVRWSDAVLELASALETLLGELGHHQVNGLRARAEQCPSLANQPAVFRAIEVRDRVAHRYTHHSKEKPPTRNDTRRAARALYFANIVARGQRVAEDPSVLGAGTYVFNTSGLLMFWAAAVFLTRVPIWQLASSNTSSSGQVGIDSVVPDTSLLERQLLRVLDLLPKESISALIDCWNSLGKERQLLDLPSTVQEDIENGLSELRAAFS